VARDAVTASGDPVFSLDTRIPRVSLINGTELRLYSDAFNTVTMNLDAFNGRLSLAGDIISTGGTPGLSPETAAGSGATGSISGTNLCGLITLTTGTGPTTGKVASIYWPFAKPSDYAVVLTAANAAAVTAMSRLYVDQAAQTLGGTALTATVALAASTTYQFSFSALCY
jgi:hypothetical protein